jgi:hypothetical protein
MAEKKQHTEIEPASTGGDLLGSPHREFDARRRAKFLELVAQGVPRSAAARGCGVHRATVWRAMKNDEQFAAEVAYAEDLACDEVESALFQAAVNGNVVAQQVWLYNRRPDRWMDKRNVQVTGAGGGPVQVQAVDPMEVFSLRIEEIRRRLELPSGDG